MNLETVEIDGNKLREARESRNLTLQDVATEIGVLRGTVHNYEKGNAKPSADVLARICIFFGVSVQDLTNFKNFV